MEEHNRVTTLSRAGDRELARHSGVSVPPVFADGDHVLELAARGAFCEIWRIHDPASLCDLAVKCLQPNWRDDEAARRLLVREGEAGRATRSRHVIAVLSSQQDADVSYNVLEWFDGEPLAERLDRCGSLSVGDTVWIARQCCRALHDLCQAGYAHGDVKPDNVVMDADGVVKLVDLGFACPLDATCAADDERPLTGTPHYLAPESLLQKPGDPILRDMYSLGVMLYRMLTGRLPFLSETTEGVLRQHRSSRPPHLAELRPEAPPGLTDLVTNMLAKEPLRRPASHAHVMRELLNLEVRTLAGRFAA